MIMTSRLIQPPEIVGVEGPIIFAAGPIQDAPKWQYQAAENIHEIDSDIVVASPRKEYAPGEFVYEKQVDWETYYLKGAAYGLEPDRRKGVILFWLAKQISQTIEKGQKFPRSYAQTTRQELGEWRAKKQNDPSINLVVGIEEGFGNERYIKRRFSQDCPDVPILSSLLETCEVAVELIHRSNA
jgi:hypothetical protein